MDAASRWAHIIEQPHLSEPTVVGEFSAAAVLVLIAFTIAVPLTLCLTALMSIACTQ